MHHRQYPLDVFRSDQVYTNPNIHITAVIHEGSQLQDANVGIL
jgi:hypothetical protein